MIRGAFPLHRPRASSPSPPGVLSEPWALPPMPPGVLSEQWALPPMPPGARSKFWALPPVPPRGTGSYASLKTSPYASGLILYQQQKETASMVVCGGGALGHRHPSLGPPRDNPQGIVSTLACLRCCSCGAGVKVIANHMGGELPAYRQQFALAGAPHEPGNSPFAAGFVWLRALQF